MSPRRRFKIYATLLSLYPASYRKQYTEQILQTVADMIDDAPSTSEKFTTWVRICLDFPVTLCKEHFQIIGDHMNTHNKPYKVGHKALMSAGLFLLPIAMLTVNRLLMLSGPGRGIPTYYLVITSVIFPLLAIAMSGFTLYRLLRSPGTARLNLRQVTPLACICLLSLAFLAWIISEEIRYYILTH